MKLNVNKVLLTLFTALALFLAGCGEPVPPNKVAIVVKTMGERSTNVVASSELYWARRLPFGSSMSPGIRVYIFPLGLQDYSFNQESSYESPNNDPIEVDCIGGHLKFDVNLQMYIDMSVTNLADRLLAFINDHQLQSYNGEHNMLSRWAGEKLKQFVREPLAPLCLNRQMIDVIRSKKEFNDVLLEAMNRRFNKYGLVFCAAGITSPIYIPDDQKGRIVSVVQNEYRNQALIRRNTDYNPVTNAIVQIEQVGLTECQNALNEGVTESARIENEAWARRREALISVVGPSNYVRLESMLAMSAGLTNSHLEIKLIPSSLMSLGAQIGVPEKTEMKPALDKSAKK